MAIKRKRVIRSGDQTEPPANAEEQSDHILLEIGRLYRERVRALYNNDQPALQTIAVQIDTLKARLPKI